jgi:hypothetical protein
MSYRLSGCPQAAISLAPDLNAFQHNTQVQGKYNAASANFFQPVNHPIQVTADRAFCTNLALANPPTTL